MLNLKKRKPDVRAFVHSLEQWLINTLDDFNIKGERREGRVGIWVNRPKEQGPGEDKIAAIGIRVHRWVTFHGISLNIDPDLTHFDGIVPCGISEHGVTSFEKLGLPVTMPEVDMALKRNFESMFGALD